MMSEDYVSFETAKLLKEKGFECEETSISAMYNEDGIFHSLSTTSALGGYLFDDFDEYDFIAPTLQMAMKWLREVHKVHICVQPLVECGYTAYIYDVADKDDYGIIQGIPHHKTYEEAVEAAIKYCLENLI